MAAMRVARFGLLLALLSGTTLAAPADAPSLFLQRNRTLAHTLEARRVFAAIGDALRVPVGAPALSVAVPARLPPSGVVSAVVSWPALAVAARAGDAITLHCAGADMADLGDLLVLTATHVAAGRVTVPLVRGGCAYELRYIAGGAALLSGMLASGAVVAAASAPIALGADTDASGTRVAFGDTAGDLQLSWFSGNATARAYVRVATAAGGPYGPPIYAGAAPVTYATTDMCHKPATEASIVAYLSPGYLHTVALPLNASTRYFAVYGQEGGAEAPETSFRTRSPPGPDVRTRFAAFGDSATYPVFPGTVTTFDLIDAMDAEGDATPIDFVAVVGDLAYAEGCVRWGFGRVCRAQAVARRTSRLHAGGGGAPRAEECVCAVRPPSRRRPCPSAQVDPRVVAVGGPCMARHVAPAVPGRSG